jgi:putative transposase
VAGLIHHSYRGSQYCSGEYQALLRSHELKVSMNRKGNCYNSAPIESFFGTLKTELVQHRAGCCMRSKGRAAGSR